MTEPRLKMPDLSRPQKYEHRAPHRPTHLPKRLTPPPKRSEPPDLSLFLYAGLALVIVLIVMALPYAVGYLFEVLF